MLTRSLALAALFAAASLPAQDKHLLRLKLTPGTVVHHAMTMDSTMEMEMGGQKMTMKMGRELFAKFTVAAVKDDTATIEILFTRMKLQADTPMGRVNFDSDDEEDVPPMFAGMDALIGAKLQGKLTTTGKLVEVKLPDDLEGNQVGKDLEQSLSQSMLEFPAEPIAIGGTWTSEIEVGGGQVGEVKLVLTNKLVAVTPEVVTVEQTAKIDDAGDAPEGATLKVTEGKGSGQINLATGMPKDMTVHMTLQMAGPDGKRQMTMKAKQTVKEYTPAPKKDGDK